MLGGDSALGTSALTMPAGIIIQPDVTVYPTRTGRDIGAG